MITTAYLNIWDQRIGAVAWDSNSGIGSFEYEPSFLEMKWNLSPIKLPIQNARKRIFSFPELKGNNTFKGLPGLLADTLPDHYGNALINSWFTTQGRPSGSLNPIETLCFIGKRGMGAIEIEPARGGSGSVSKNIEIDSLILVAEKILTNRKNFSLSGDREETKAFYDILKIGTSAGGARAKAIISFNEETEEIRSGQFFAPEGFEHWLIKFDGVMDKQFGASNGYGRVEMAYYEMARDAGLDMMESKLLEENDRAHFMTKRFDRTRQGEKIHVQTFCALRHFDFDNVLHYSYEQLFETMRMLRLPYAEAEQMYRRMAFNVMSRNCDDHTKNFAFMMNKNGKWKLAPAYDICHAYRPGSQWVSQHSLSINGKRANITRQDLLDVAYQMNVKKASSILDEIHDTIADWNSYADRYSVEPELMDAINRTLVLI
ncbi:MAG: type II toxin-antitoxin system HipA family toxin [Balneola sp.]